MCSVTVVQFRIEKLDDLLLGPMLAVKSHVIISPSAAGPSFAPENYCTGLSSPFNGSKPHEPHPSSSPHHTQNTR